MPFMWVIICLIVTLVVLILVVIIRTLNISQATERQQLQTKSTSEEVPLFYDCGGLVILERDYNVLPRYLCW